MLKHFSRMMHVHRQALLTDMRRLGEALRSIAEVSRVYRHYGQIAFLAFAARSVFNSVNAEKHPESFIVNFLPVSQEVKVPNCSGSFAETGIVMMAILESYESPDKILHLLLDVTGDDWTVGFAGYSWHTHGDILYTWGCDGSPEQAARQFVREIISSQREICVYRRDGTVIDVAVPGLYDGRPLLDAFNKYAPPNESMEVRYWSA